MPTEVSIQDYSEKSFVVRGEGTRDLRESLRALGGKWNNSLTDKNTGERFGGWIFWSDKRSDVQDWFDGGCNPVAPPSTSSGYNGQNGGPSRDHAHRVGALEAKIDELTRMVSLLCEHFDLDSTTVVLSDDDEPAGPPRRLLKR